MHNYENLQVWQRAMDLTVRVYKATVHFPSDERFGLTGQLRRASASIPMNIAEGSGNASNKEFCRFLEIALRSGYELLTGIEIAKRLEYLPESSASDLAKELREIISMLVGLMRSLSKSARTATSLVVVLLLGSWFLALGSLIQGVA
ncbi:MAG: four helix bundle protein [Candidatus Brachytrichaceae bacterium NZ_4S206]|jgi:four helix bundle protein